MTHDAGSSECGDERQPTRTNDSVLADLVRDVGVLVVGLLQWP